MTPLHVYYFQHGAKLGHTAPSVPQALLINANYASAEDHIT